MTDHLKPGPWLKIHQELGVQPPNFDDRPLGTFIESYAESIPDNSALRYFERDISYRELNELSNRLANSLATLGVSRNDVVGLHLPNIPQIAIAVVALSKLGATATGISTVLAPAEVAYQLEDAGVSVLIALDSLAKPTIEVLGSLPDCVKTVIVTGANDLLQEPRQPRAFELQDLELPALVSVTGKSYLQLTEEASSTFQQIDLAPDHVYLIQYTGGTTGKPKGAMLTLRGIMYHLSLLHIYRPWQVGTETVACSAPLFHIGGLGLLLAALKFGARYLLIPDARDLDHFCQQMVDCPPTRLGGVPTQYQMIADHPLSAEIDFSGVRNVITGSAPITGEDRKRIERMLHGAVLADCFGMTEGPAFLVNPPDRCKPEAVGIPLPAIDVRIVDLETGARELSYGEAGEIIAASPTLMKGYLNRPEETANALRKWQGKIWMHTGDVGVMDEDGYVYLKDRVKDMIIVSGFKVFSVEVEDKLSTLEFISSSALVGTPDTRRPGSEVVNLYVELTMQAKQLGDPEKFRADILEFCRAEMAAYKVPKVIHIVDAIPLTAIGKIDKKALRVALGRR